MKKYERDIPERPTRSGKENHDVQCDGIAGRRRTACTREASRLISCGDISVRIGIRFGTNTKCQCTPSISDGWDEADPARALSNRMTRSAQIARDGRWPCLARE